MGALQSSHFGKTNLRSDPVATESGPIIGKRFDIGEDRYVDAFLGVPFAKPPIGDLRYKKPTPPGTWEERRLCIEHGPQPPQKVSLFEKLGPKVIYDEDCLYLNVFAPAWDPPSDQPTGRAVMVFVPGGGFAMHGSAYYGDVNICRQICSREVVVVTIQYRLGLLGFIATGDDCVIPNLGLWDQALALKWVKDNIKNFKGDPDNITLFGGSAGGISVDMLALSPHTSGLFSKLIPTSGTASCDCGLRTASEVRQSAIEFAERIGWKRPGNVNESETNESLMEFLKNQPSKKLGTTMELTGTEMNPYAIFFTPVIDGDFLPEPIPELRKKAPKKLCMTGTTEYEGLLFAGAARNIYGVKVQPKILSFFIPEWKYNNAEQLRQKAAEIYFPRGQSKPEVAKSHVKVISDTFINNGVHDFANDMTLAGHTVFLYSFAYDNPRVYGVLRYLFPFSGVTHGGDVAFLFGKSPMTNFAMTVEDARFADKFTTFFTNFAKYGDPNGNDGERIWLPLTPDDTYRYLLISKEICMKDNYEGKRVEFWRSIKSELKS